MKGQTRNLKTCEICCNKVVWLHKCKWCKRNCCANCYHYNELPCCSVCVETASIEEIEYMNDWNYFNAP